MPSAYQYWKPAHRAAVKRKDPSDNLLGELMGLRHFVENINRTPDLALRNGIYQALDKTSVFTRGIDGFEYGYKLEDRGVIMRRKLFIKTPGYKLSEIPDNQKDLYVTAAMMVFMDQGASPPVISIIAQDCLLLEQDFSPMFLTRINN